MKYLANAKKWAAFLLSVLMLTAICLGCEQKEEIFNDTDFSFGYALRQQTYQKGSRAKITVDLVNDSDRRHSFYGSRGMFVASPVLYCVIDGSEYQIPAVELVCSDMQSGTVIIDAHQKSTRTYYFDIPRDAPSGPYHLRVSYKNAEETFSDIFTLLEPQQTVIPNGTKKRFLLGFGYEYIDGTPERGQSITFDASLTNGYPETYTYTGTYSDFTPAVRLYHGNYVLEYEATATSDEIALQTVAPNETRRKTYTFFIPEDAPGGYYDLQLTYGEESVTFFSIFVVPEMPEPALPGAYAERTNFGFGYQILDGIPKKGGQLAINAMLTNISDQSHSYIGSGEFKASALLYCETDGKQTVIHCQGFLSSDDVTKMVAVPGEHYDFTYYFQIPEDAPIGSYHLQLAYSGESVTFENIFTLS